jgi:ABC-2 type transport system permease protein
VSARTQAIRTGAHKGWTEFKMSLKSPQDQGYYLFTALLILGYLFFRRNSPVEGTSLLYPTVALPSILGALIGFNMIIGPAYSLAMEREDGTLLRARATPHGVTGHVTGQIVGLSLGLVPSLLVVLVPAALFFDGVMQRGATGWLTMLGIIVVGLIATLPIGIIIGSLVPSVQKVGTWGMLPIMFLLAISGIFFPIQGLWNWLQPIAQVFPLYWLGLGMRSAFLPEQAAVVEIAQSWRTPETFLILGAWAIAGLIIAPPLLRRMARGQSGSRVEAARLEATQWVR